MWDTREGQQSWNPYLHQAQVVRGRNSNPTNASRRVDTVISIWLPVNILEASLTSILDHSARPEEIIWLLQSMNSHLGTLQGRDVVITWLLVVWFKLWVPEINSGTPYHISWEVDRTVMYSFSRIACEYKKVMHGNIMFDLFEQLIHEIYIQLDPDRSITLSIQKWVHDNPQIPSQMH